MRVVLYLDIEDKIKSSRAAVFDFDGTLWTIHLDWDELYRRFSEVGRSYGHVGEFGSILDAYQWSRKVYRARINLIEVQDEFEKDGLPGSPVNAGIAAARWRIKKGMGTAILSLNTSSTIEEVLGSSGFYPIISIDKVERPKPDPEGMLLALRTLECGPGDAVFIGNSDTDRKCAEAASIPYIDVTQIKEEWFQ